MQEKKWRKLKVVNQCWELFVTVRAMNDDRLRKMRLSKDILPSLAEASDDDDEDVEEFPKRSMYKNWVFLLSTPFPSVSLPL